MAMSMAWAMRAMPASMIATLTVTVPGLGAIAGTPMLPTMTVDVAMLHITVMNERPNVMIMRRRHPDIHTDTRGSQRRHGEGGGGEAKSGEKMLGGFHVSPFY